MLDQGLGGSSGGGLPNRRKSAITGWAVPRWNGIPGKGWVVNRFFKFRTGGVGCAIEGWDIFRGRRFQAIDSVNQSVNLVS